jgi:uncharacterized membrane protein
LRPTVAVELVHVISALAFGAGYISTNVLVELARVTDDPVLRRVALGLSGWFDRFLVLPFGVLAGVSGLALTVMIGYPVTGQWVWLSTLLFLAVMALALFVWRRRDERVEAALATDDEEAAATILREPWAFVLARAENVAVFIVVTLMVVRPN